MSSPGAHPGQNASGPAPPLTQANGAAEQTFDADVIGVDVIGFSRFTQRLVDSKGAGAAEEVRDVLDIGFRAVAERLKDQGFAAVDSIGDGIVLARAQTAGGDLTAIVRQAEQAFSAALGTLRVRAAHAAGRLSLCRIGGLQQRWDVVATGPAIEALHAAIRRKRELEPVRIAGDSVDIAPRQPLPARAHGDARSISEIRRLAVAFVAVKPPASLLSAPLATLQDIAVLGQGLAEAWGGQLEKVTHDDKGLLFDFGFARTRDVGVTALDSALDFILDIQPLLVERGLTPRFGLAEGFVYRGALALGERAIPIVHGPAVNLGAKLAASGQAELALDWPAAQKLVARFRDFAAGVEHALPEGVRYVGFALKDVLNRPSAKPLSANFTGRAAELAVLTAGLARLQQGDGGLISLSGSPGIGKTKLLNGMRNALPPTVCAHWLRADPRRASELMSLWRDLARPLALTIADGENTIAAALTHVLAGEGIADELHAIVDDVIPDSGLKRSARLDALEGIARRDLLERAIVALAVSAARRSPMLICLDDAHWFDDASCRVLSAVLRAAPQLLVVLSHRPGRYASLDHLSGACPPGRTTIFVLEPLRRDDIKSIARTASPILSQDDAALEQVFNLSGGNPFHAEQIAHLLHERVAQSVAALARDLADGPEVIEHVLDERLDGLSPLETQIVRTLSILDRPASPAALAAFAGASAPATDAALAHLAAHAFIEIDDARAAAMKHRMLSDAVVGRIPPREAQVLHAGAARFIRRLRGSKHDPTIGDAVIAHHWREAGERRRAAVGFGKAGDGVLYAGAPDLAIKFYGEALASLSAADTAKAVPRVAGWHAGRAVAHWARGEMHEGLADATQALTLIDTRIGGPNWLPRGLRKSIARARRVVLAPTPLGNRLVPRNVRLPLVTVSAIRAEMAFFLGDAAAIISSSASMIGFAGEPRLRARARARAYLFVGHAASLLKLQGAAHGAWNKARAIGTVANDPVASSHGYLGEAIWHMSHGRWSEADRQLEMGAELFGDVADPSYHKFVETLLALGAYLRGDWQDCTERFAALQAVGINQGNRSTEAWGCYGQAEALIIPARWDDAEAFLASAEPIVEAMPDRQSLIICKGLRTQLEFGRGNLQSALDRGLECLALARVLTVNNFGSLEGFAAPAEVLLRLARDDEVPPFVRASARANVKPAMKALKRFAGVHPIARPRLHLCEAMLAGLERRVGREAKHLSDGLAFAQSLDMRFECHKLQHELDLRRNKNEDKR